MSARGLFRGSRRARLVLPLLAVPGIIVAATMPASAAPAAAGAALHVNSVVPIPDRWMVTLKASPTGLLPGQASTLTATANMDVEPTPYYLRIYDETTGAYVATCGSGTTCSTTVTQPAPVTDDYMALVSDASPSYPPGSVQAGSASVAVVWRYLILR
jgi:hypothetical protein